MTPEEIQKTMDFILRSQADSVIRMERFEERMERSEERMDRSEERMDRLDERMERHVSSMEAADKKFHAKAENLQEQLDLLATAARDLLEVSRRHEKAVHEHSKRIARLEDKGR